MFGSRSLALAALTLSLSLTATAQNCSDNTYALHLVTAAGVELPTSFDPVLGHTSYQAPTETVYLAVPANLPSGTYYVHVTDDPIDGSDEVLSQNDPMDRFVSVTNTNGVITLSLPFSGNPNPALFGLGLGGQGQSLLLAPLGSPTFSVCRFKAWYGNSWDLANGPTNPYLIAGGIHPTLGGCAIRSYTSFRVGSGNGSDVSGVVFHDQDRDGVRDPGEALLPNWEVRLVTGGTSVSAITNGSGAYLFTNVEHGGYTVELQLKPGFIATTPSVHLITVCECANVVAPDFGVAPELLPSNGRTPGFWGNKNGLALIVQYNILPTLPALHLVNANGQYVAPATTAQFKSWLQGATAVNMAYMLSAHVAAMHCNIVVGGVDADAVINDPGLGIRTIGSVLQDAIVSLGLYPYTPVGHPQRANQELLKNALDRANNNQNWL